MCAAERGVLPYALDSDAVETRDQSCWLIEPSGPVIQCCVRAAQCARQRTSKKIGVRSMFYGAAEHWHGRRRRSRLLVRPVLMLVDMCTRVDLGRMCTPISVVEGTGFCARLIESCSCRFERRNCTEWRGQVCRSETSAGDSTTSNGPCLGSSTRPPTLDHVPWHDGHLLVDLHPQCSAWTRSTRVHVSRSPQNKARARAAHCAAETSVASKCYRVRPESLLFHYR
ncbi:hypothetical protein C8Q76DRAFT_217389 [Earliella scabrosa]|nr:hypothetical protein C8Q76DRAFT_217389 [Earliella scabrosa]